MGGWLLGSFTFVYKSIKDKNRDVLNVYFILSHNFCCRKKSGVKLVDYVKTIINNETNLSNAQTLRDGLDEPIFFITSSFPNQPLISSM